MPEATANRLIIFRDLIQYRLLQLPSGSGWTEICRLAALIYSYGIFYPLPDPRPTTRLAHKLGRLMLRLWPTPAVICNLRFLLWGAFMGGIATAGSAKQYIFVTFIAQYVTTAGIVGWDAISSLLEEFLWLECACGEIARLLLEQSMLLDADTESIHETEEELQYL